MSVEQAKSFLQTLKTSSIYAGIGKVDPWNLSDTVDPNAVNAPDSIIRDLNDSVFLKKCIPGQFTMAAVRYDWEEDTVYDQWNGADIDLYKKKFYVVNDTGFIYKCLSNNSGAPSTIMPNSTSPERFTTSDGYVWKLIAVVPEPVALQFNNSAYVPVRTITEPLVGYEVQFASQETDIAGTVDRIDVVQPGTRYSDQTYVRITGDGHGATATVNRHPITGEILSVEVTNNGFGYQFVNVEIVDPANIHGEGAIAVAVTSPYGGHGSDPETELFATRVIGSIELQGNEGGFIDGTLDFRKVFLVSDLEKPMVPAIQFRPIAGDVFADFTSEFSVRIKSNLTAYSMVVRTNDATLGEFTVFASPSQPYGENESWFSDKDITVAFDDLKNEWIISFGANSQRLFENGVEFITQLLDADSDVVYGNLDAPLVGNTFAYRFTDNQSVSNIPSSDFVAGSEIDDSRYNFTVKLNLTGVTGTFVMGETVTFTNGGTGAVVYVDPDYITITSPVAIMTGVINGVTSAANAIVTSIENRPFFTTGKAIYQHYLDKRTKIVDQNLKMVPIFEF